MSMTRLKRVATLRAGGTPPVEDRENWSDDPEVGTPWVSIGDMSDGAVVTSTGRRVSDAALRGKRLPVGEPGTLLFAMYASVGAVADLGIPATWNQALLGISARPGLSYTPFLRYWLEHLRRDLPALVRSNTQDNLNADQVGSFPFPQLALSTQRAIADFLDRETARIDTLIAKKRRMIDLLEERRDSTIRTLLREVTNRLPLKRKWRVIDCKHRTPTYTATGYPVISPGDVTAGRLDLDRAHRFVGEQDFGDLADHLRRLRRGDIVYSRNASIGIASYVDTDEPFCMGQDVCRITSEDQDQLFLSYVLNTLGVDQLDEQKIGSTFNRVNVAQILDLEIPTPDPATQRSLARRFDEMTERGMAAIQALNGQIDLLLEHRQALITAAVTGELEVPGVAA